MPHTSRMDTNTTTAKTKKTTCTCTGNDARTVHELVPADYFDEVPAHWECRNCGATSRYHARTSAKRARFAALVEQLAAAAE